MLDLVFALSLTASSKICLIQREKMWEEGVPPATIMERTAECMANTQMIHIEVCRDNKGNGCYRVDPHGRYKETKS